MSDKNIRDSNRSPFPHPASEPYDVFGIVIEHMPLEDCFLWKAGEWTAKKMPTLYKYEENMNKWFNYHAIDCLLPYTLGEWNKIETSPYDPIDDKWNATPFISRARKLHGKLIPYEL